VIRHGSVRGKGEKEKPGVYPQEPADRPAHNVASLAGPVKSASIMREAKRLAFITRFWKVNKENEREKRDLRPGRILEKARHTSATGAALSLIVLAPWQKSERGSGAGKLFLIAISENPTFEELKRA
jgi:hypothetical protein